MSDPLPVRIGYRLRFVEDPMARSLLVEARAALEGGDRCLTGRVVMEWLEEKGVKLVPWQVSKLEGL